MITINAQAGDQVELQIYNLNGQPVFDSGIVSGRTLQWNLQNNSGQLVANGVYCYRVTVWDASGHTTRSPIKELFVLR
jgi:flagellar hook assembly protein FlgD